MCACLCAFTYSPGGKYLLCDPKDISQRRMSVNLTSQPLQIRHKQGRERTISNLSGVTKWLCHYSFSVGVIIECLVKVKIQHQHHNHMMQQNKACSYVLWTNNTFDENTTLQKSAVDERCCQIF